MPNYFQICDVHIREAYEPSTVWTQSVTSNLPDLVTPSTIWTFISDEKTWMVRQKYHVAISAIIQWVHRANSVDKHTEELDHIFFTPTETLQEDWKEYPNPLSIVVKNVTKRLAESEVDLFHRLLASKSDLSWRSLAAFFYNGSFPQYLMSDRTLCCSPMISGPLRFQNQQTRSWVTDTDAPQGIRMTGITVQYFNSTVPPAQLKVGTLYVPSVMNFPTMDAFLVRSASHVVMYQATIAGTHDFSIEGLKWLQSRLCR
ncbi:hypothetical protein D9757_005835 [Collybiopsis confluens]|uniref:Uncharacterized protein n=1 Tax=Collybiopsis confluens TaxID=2823264 RepID=A0A8H5HNC5_9AGAR|nr:hypothetical protein D9757_005835 [Collybiopsis confluens]